MGWLSRLLTLRWEFFFFSFKLREFLHGVKCIYLKLELAALWKMKHTPANTQNTSTTQKFPCPFSSHSPPTSRGKSCSHFYHLKQGYSDHPISKLCDTGATLLDFLILENHPISLSLSLLWASFWPEEPRNTAWSLKSCKLISSHFQNDYLGTSQRRKEHLRLSRGREKPFKLNLATGQVWTSDELAFLKGMSNRLSWFTSKW